MKMIFVISSVIFLSACDGTWLFWSHTQVETASKRCLSKGGKPQMALNSNKRVLNMYCQFENGDTYQINTKGEF